MMNRFTPKERELLGDLVKDALVVVEDVRTVGVGNGQGSLLLYRELYDVHQRLKNLAWKLNDAAETQTSDH